jgi:hypothetical protein
MMDERKITETKRMLLERTTAAFRADGRTVILPKYEDALKAVIEDDLAVGLYGNVGTGKTHFFRLLDRHFYRGSLRIWSMTAASMLALDDLLARLESLQNSDVVLDDIGSEILCNNYGTRYECLPVIVEARLASPCRTHYTTNLTPDEITARYGARVADRLTVFAKAFRLEGCDGRGGSFRREPRRHAPPRTEKAVRQWSDCAAFCALCTGWSCLAGRQTPKRCSDVQDEPWTCPAFAPTDERRELLAGAAPKEGGVA